MHTCRDAIHYHQTKQLKILKNSIFVSREVLWSDLPLSQKQTEHFKKRVDFEDLRTVPKAWSIFRSFISLWQKINLIDQSTTEQPKYENQMLFDINLRFKAWVEWYPEPNAWVQSLSQTFSLATASTRSLWFN